jgi:hypothetical protein
MLILLVDPLPSFADRMIVIGQENTNRSKWGTGTPAGI